MTGTESILLNFKELANFAKPKAWTKNLWELDELEPNNNGFQVNQIDRVNETERVAK